MYRQIKNNKKVFVYDTFYGALNPAMFVSKERDTIKLIETVFSSEALRSNIGGDVDGIGWVTYSRCIKRMPKFSPNLVHETKNNGHLFYLANWHSYDYSLINELRSLKKRIR
ncbi:hypothetical protein DVR12_26915 [Chitinophaga silvatica]|uniref:Uncharacterized protein n=1 Tax=Chitinophaga silvatica TaxID=2282649 RepID=A0A3E1Y1W2_9BACT|nr:hypothetical protein [Chitinophaga silvatica]RFS18680.1 hypothetical protein DVR12_26915 [Chitinophaga silvatica]